MRTRTSRVRARQVVRSLLAQPSVAHAVVNLGRPVARALPARLRYVVPVSGVHRIRIDAATSMRWRFAGADPVAQRAVWGGLAAYEPATIPVLLDLARRSTAVWDIGANSGVLSLAMAAVAPAAQVHAFEPLPRLAAVIRSNVALNAATNVTVHEVALGASVGTAELYVPDGDFPTESSLMEGFRSGAQPTRVAVSTVDVMVESGVPPPQLMKVDTEGTELDVVRGAMRTVTEHRPVIICEVLANRSAERVYADLLEPLGYRAHLLTDDGPQERSEVKGDPTERYLNYLFAC